MTGFASAGQTSSASFGSAQIAVAIGRSAVNGSQERRPHHRVAHGEPTGIREQAISGARVYYGNNFPNNKHLH
jgi:hypothetical protein